MHVVVGLNGPPPSTQDIPQHEEEAPETPVVHADARPTLEVIPERSLELVRQESLELVRQETLELVREAVVAQPPLVVEPPDPEPAAHESPRDVPYVPYEQEAFDDELGSYSASAPETPMVHVTAITTPDEISIPPASDVAVEPALESFFEEGDRASTIHVSGALVDDSDDWGDELGNQKAKLKASPEAIARRAKFSRVVVYAVAVAAVVCVAGFVRSAGRPIAASASAKTTTAITAVAPPAEKAAQPAAIAAPLATDEPKTPEPKVAEPKVEAPAAEEPKAEASKAADAPKVDEPKAAAVSDKSDKSDKTALEEKKLSQRALERGKLVDAIEAGERSVALDPTDGEAWLILGASYQSKGNGKDARRCYAACVKEGKRGPLGECRAMLR